MKLKSVYKDKNVELKVSKQPPAWYIWVRPAANLLPIDSDGRILIMHEFKATTKEWIWGFPGGIIEPGETAVQAAKRECEEELGLRVVRTKMITEVKTNFPKTSVTYFAGYGLSKTKSKGWEKIGKIKRVNIKQLNQLASDGKIQDPRMVVAILQLCKKVKRGVIKLKF